jgi:hypothetical protein
VSLSVTQSGNGGQPGIQNVLRLTSLLGAVYGAQRNTNCIRDRGLRHSALAQQHHLNALTLRRRDFSPQRCFQFPDLLFCALDHPSSRIR